VSTATRWNLTKPKTASGPGAELDRNPARVLSVIALASIAAGAINLAAAATVGRSNAQNLAFFVVVTVVQLAWGAVALVRAPRWWLALGGAANLVVAVTWVVSRTAGLPVGPEAHSTLPAHFPDTLATVLEVVVVVGAVALLVRGRGLAASAARSLGVTVAAAVVVGALAIGGVVSQATSSSSPAGGSQHSGAATSGTSGGGSTSGGGTSGGGSTSGGGYAGGGSYGY
jgi:hypothetical protein